MGAEGAAMGSARCAVAGDFAAVFYNPATLSGVERFELTLQYHHAMERRYEKAPLYGPSYEAGGSILAGGINVCSPF